MKRASSSSVAGRAAWSAVGLFSALGCGASVDDLRPKHAIICSGEPVKVAWKVTGSETVTVSPETPREQVTENSFVIHPTVARTLVTIHVSRLFSHADGETEIDIDGGELVNASIADPNAKCDAANNTLTSTAHMNPASFAPDVRVTTIAVDGKDPRTYTVKHDGKTATIKLRRSSDAFRSAAIAGDWTISTELVSGESCDPPKLPMNLPVRAFTTCGEKASP